MQGMHGAALHRGIGGAQRLPQHLPAEHLRRADVATGATKQVDLQRFQLQQLQQFSQWSQHGAT